MLSIDVLNLKREKIGQVELDSEIFDRPVNKDILHEVVRWQLATRRQGTHMTKTKGLVSGGGKKPFKQKGTGGARQGSTRSILMPGGGTAFGPQPRNYTYALPKKVRKAGLSIALTYLLKEKKLFILDDLVSTGKTKDFVRAMGSFGLSRAVIIDENTNEKSRRGSRNLKDYRYFSVDGMNVFDLLKYDNAIILKSALEKVMGRCRTSERVK
jgi:large subunit ribosomal protein L4